jgi:nitrogen fixation NifU-like protein
VIEDGILVEVATQGQGCSISQASGSMMADVIKGKTVEEVEDLATKFKLMMSIEEGESPVDPARPGAVLGDLEALQGVRKFPVRIKCADLPWATLADALDKAKAAQ